MSTDPKSYKLLPKPQLSCSVAMCKNFNNPYADVELFQFPFDSNQRQVFSDMLGIPHSVAKKSSARVCALHFKSKVLTNTSLAKQLRKNDTPAIQSFRGLTVGNASNVFTSVNPTTFTTSNFGYVGQPITFYLQKKPVSNTSMSVPNTGSSILKPIISSSISIPTGKEASNSEISSEDRIISLVEDSSDNVDTQEIVTDEPLDMQCEDELLSQAQLNSYYSDLVKFITANGIVMKIPPQVNTATISTQTDPVTILTIGPQPSTSSESSGLNSIQVLQSGTSKIGDDDDICILDPIPPTSFTDDASLKVNKNIERSNVLVNSAQAPSTNMIIDNSQAPTTITISPNAIPVCQSIPPDDVSKLYYYLSEAKNLNSGMVPATPSASRFVSKPPPPYQSLEHPQGTSLVFKQVHPPNRIDSNLTNQSQPTGLPNLPSASNTLVSMADQANHLIRTGNGLALTMSNQPVGIPFQNQVAYDPSLNTQFKVISLTDNHGQPTVPLYTSADRPFMNDDHRYIPYSSSRFNSNQAKSYTATNIGDTPYQLLIQNDDQPNFLYSLPAQGTLPELNTAASSLPSAIDNDSDKDADLLDLCNVTAVYGSETPPSTPVPAPNPILHDDDSRSTLSGNESPFVSESDNSQNSMGPLIVDVISASEGAKEYYIGDKMPNILLDKGTKDTVDKKKKDVSEKSKLDSTFLPNKNVYSAGDKVPNLLFDESKKTNSSKDAVANATSMNKNTGAPGQTIKLNNSVFSLQTSIPVIPSGSKRCTDIKTLLDLKVPVGKTGLDDANLLRKRLRTEKFITCSVWWLIRRNYMPSIDPCSCKSYAFHINRSPNHADGYCWQCANLSCNKEVPIKRPKFFEYFPTYKLEILLLLTYHWACQTPLEEMLKDVDLKPEQIFAYFQALQKVCHQVSLKKCKLGSPNSMVEAALVKLGNFFVIGAYDRRTNHTRLEPLSQSDAYSTTIHIQLLENWLNKKTSLVTDKKISDEFLNGITKHGAISSETSHSSKGPHILNVTKYLIHNLALIFGIVKQTDLSLEIVKGFLYELQWRRKYGKFQDMSFWSIMNHIRDINDDEEMRVTAKPGNLDISTYVRDMKPLFRSRWGPIRFHKVKTPEKSTAFNSPVKLNAQVQSSTKSYSKPTYNANPNPVVAWTTKRVITLTKAPTACDLFQDVPEIPLNTNASNINSKSLLAIKIRCEEATPPGIYKPNATSLGLQLRTEGFISDPVQWLVKRGYMRSIAPCYVCTKTSMLRVNPKYKDGCSWLCQNKDCQFENMFRRPEFFARFSDLPMAQIAAMIFHWTVQSDYNIVISDVPLESVKISHAWRAFQVLCSSALKRDHFKIGGDWHIVEVAMVRYGRMNILGARQRGTKRTLLKCFPIEMKYQVELVHDTLRSWIIDRTHVVVDAAPSLQLPNHCKFVPADTSVTDRTSTKMHVLNVTSYLLKHVFEMFGHLRADLIRPQLMQMYLDELMWRERFGKLPNLAFAKIMYEIFYHEKNRSVSVSFSAKMFDRQSEMELLDEELPVPVVQKEVCVLLHRIPQTVLKYYNCLSPDGEILKFSSVPSTTSPISLESSSSLVEKPFTLLPERSANSEPPKKKKKIFDRSKGNAARKGDMTETSSSESESEVWSNSTATVDEESSSSEEDPLDELVSEFKETAENYRGSNSASPIDPSVITKETITPITDTTDNATPTNNLPDANSVPPLVIRVNKDPTKSQSYLKSEFLKTKYKRQRARKFNTKRRPKRKVPQKKPVFVGIPGVVVKQEVMDDEPGPSGLCQSVNSESASGVKSVKRRFGVKNVCVECGKEGEEEHFIKQFNCTDCTRTVYTTCCGNAFFEHRSALLFGKRPLRRDRVKHGLHRPRTLSYSAICPCGFKSKIGNQMASHLVKCTETSCFFL